MPQLRSVPGLALGLVLGIGAQPLVLEVPSSGDRRALSSAGLVRSGSLLRGSNKGGIWESGADPRGPRPRGATSSAPRNAGPRSDLPPFPDEAGSIPQGGKNCAHANSELPGEEPGWRALARKGPPPRRTGEARALLGWVRNPRSQDPCVLGSALSRLALLHSPHPSAGARDQGDSYQREKAGPEYFEAVYRYLFHRHAYVVATALFAADVGLWYGAHAPTVDRVLALARAHPSGSIRNSARVALGSFRTSDPRLAEAHLVGLGEPDAEHLRNAVVRLYLDLGKYELAFDPDQERDLLAAVQGLVGHPVDAIDWHARGSAELLAAPAAERLEIWRAQRRRDR